jgi:hypothetical protein
MRHALYRQIAEAQATTPRNAEFLRNKSLTIGLIASAALGALVGSCVLVRDARAAVIETHYITIDGTTCMQLTGSPVVRNLTEVKGTSNNSWSLRCPIELPDATNSSVSITGLTAFGRSSSNTAELLNAALFRRAIKLHGGSRQAVTHCAIKPNAGVDTECTAAKVMHAVDDNNHTY